MSRGDLPAEFLLSGSAPCPKSSWMVRKSTPRSTRWVAKLCLSVWQPIRRFGAVGRDDALHPPAFGEAAGNDTQLRIKASQVEMPLMELSSTDLRERASDERSLRYRTPRAVEKYIETQGLYRSSAE